MWRSIADHTSGFAVEGADVGNQSLMLHLDQHLDELDPQYLYVLAVHPVTAGQIDEEHGVETLGPCELRRQLRGVVACADEEDVRVMVIQPREQGAEYPCCYAAIRLAR